MKKLAFDTLKHLKINEGVKRATNEYQDEEDELGEFIEERCVLGPDEKIERSELHSVYLGWAGDRGTRMPLKSKAFNKRMRSREGIGEKKSGVWIWHGLGLKSPSAAK